MSDAPPPPDIWRSTLRRLLLVGAAALAIPWLATFITAILAVSEMSRVSAGERVQVVAGGLIRDITTYLNLGISFEQITGASDYLRNDLAASPEIVAARLSAADGRVIGEYRRGPDALPPPGVESLSLPVARDGAEVGRLSLAYVLANVDTTVADLAGRLAVLLLALLSIGYQVVLVAWREAVLQPLRAIALQERLASKKSFAHLAVGPVDGPLHGLVETANRLVAAVNDRFAGLRDYLAEVRTMTFHPAAAAAARRLETDLAAVGRLAPDGMHELPTLSGDLFADPMLFRTGLFLGLLSCAVGGAAAQPATAAVLGGLPLAFLPSFAGVRRHISAAALVAAGGLALVAWLHSPLLLTTAAAAAGGAALSLALTVRGTSRGGATAIGRLSHAGGGFAAGGGLGTMIGDPTMAAVLAALALSLVSLVAMAARHGEAPHLEPVARERLLPLGFALAAGYWLAGVDPVAGLLPTAGLLAAGRLLPRFGATGIAAGVAAAALSVAATAWLTPPFSGGGLLLAGTGLGFAIAAATLFNGEDAGQLGIIVAGLAGGALLALATADLPSTVHRLILALAAGLAPLPALGAMRAALGSAGKERT